MKKQKISIVIPNKIGDAILILPVLICLKQLISKKNIDITVNLVVPSYLKDLFCLVKIFPVESISVFSKLKTYFLRPDKIFICEASSRNACFGAKQSYGESNTFKKYIKYTNNRDYFNFEKARKLLPKELLDFLNNKKKLCWRSISYFGLILDLGFSIDEIKNSFDLNEYNLEEKNFFDKNLKKLKNLDYMVFCMEAASGRKTDFDRRWNENYYIEIAKKLAEDYSLKSVFIGVDKSFPIPQEDFFIDLRKKLKLKDLARVLYFSKGYIGNDTGPLHISNFVKKKSVGIYLRKSTLEDYSPIFSDLTFKIYNPNSADEVYEKIKTLFEH